MNRIMVPKWDTKLYLIGCQLRSAVCKELVWPKRDIFIVAQASNPSHIVLGGAR